MLLIESGSGCREGAVSAGIEEGQLREVHRDDRGVALGAPSRHRAPAGSIEFAADLHDRPGPTIEAGRVGGERPVDRRIGITMEHVEPPGGVNAQPGSGATRSRTNQCSDPRLRQSGQKASGSSAEFPTTGRSAAMVDETSTRCVPVDPFVMMTLLWPLAAVFRPPTPEEPIMKAERTRRVSAHIAPEVGPPPNPSLCATCVEILDVGARISIMSGDNSGPVCSSSEHVRRLEDLQFSSSEGPSHDAYATDATITEPDIANTTTSRGRVLPRSPSSSMFAPCSRSRCTSVSKPSTFSPRTRTPSGCAPTNRMPTGASSGGCFRPRE